MDHEAKDQEKFEEGVPNRDGWARGKRMPLKNQQKRPNEGGKARNEDGGGSFTDDLV